MPLQHYSACVEACNRCAAACDHCATACLSEPDPKRLAHCIALDMDCADICRSPVGYMSRGSVHAYALCQLCADICDACADECSKHPMDHCRECADACHRCADECRRMPHQRGSSTQHASAVHQRTH